MITNSENYNIKIIFLIIFKLFFYLFSIYEQLNTLKNFKR